MVNLFDWNLATDVPYETIANPSGFSQSGCQPAGFFPAEGNTPEADLYSTEHRAGGILGLVYGGFRYTKETHDAKIGPLEFSVKEKETVNVPLWAGVGAIVVGGILLVKPKAG